MRQLTPKERLEIYNWLDEVYYYDPKPGGFCHHIEKYLVGEFGFTEEELEDEESCMKLLPELKAQEPESRASKWFWYPPDDKKSRQFLIQKARARCLRIVQEASISK